MKKINQNIICNLFKVGFQILENSYSAHAPPSIILTSAALITFWGRLVQQDQSQQNDIRSNTVLLCRLRLMVLKIVVKPFRILTLESVKNLHKSCKNLLLQLSSTTASVQPCKMAITDFFPLRRNVLFSLYTHGQNVLYISNKPFIIMFLQLLCKFFTDSKVSI